MADWKAKGKRSLGPALGLGAFPKPHILNCASDCSSNLSWPLTLSLPTKDPVNAKVPP